MKRAVLSFLIIASLVPAFAQAESLFLQCSRETSRYSYDIKVFQTKKWEVVGRNDQRGEAHTAVVRTDKHGKKSVRNYNGDMHRYANRGQMWVGLYKGNGDYGTLRLEYRRGKVTRATLETYGGEDERNLPVDCSFR